MKKIFTLLVALLLTFTLVSCFKSDHVVTYLDKDNNILEATNVKDGDYAKEISGPTVEGYTFKGWYLGDTKFDFKTKIKETISLKATYELTTYSVSFYYENELLETKTIKHGDKVDEFVPNKIEGYTFVGWYLGNDLYDFSKVVNSNLKLDAKYKEDSQVKYYKITLGDNLSVNVEELDSVIEGTSVTVTVLNASKYKEVKLYVNEKLVELSNNTYKFNIIEDVTIRVELKNEDKEDDKDTVNLSAKEIIEFINKTDFRIFKPRSYEGDFNIKNTGTLKVGSLTETDCKLKYQINDKYELEKGNLDAFVFTHLSDKDYVSIQYLNSMLYMSNSSYRYNEETKEYYDNYNENYKYNHEVDSVYLSILLNQMFGFEYLSVEGINEIIKITIVELLASLDYKDIEKYENVVKLIKVEDRINIKFTLDFDELFKEHQDLTLNLFYKLVTLMLTDPLNDLIDGKITFDLFFKNDEFDEFKIKGDVVTKYGESFDFNGDIRVINDFEVLIPNNDYKDGDDSVLVNMHFDDEVISKTYINVNFKYLNYHEGLIVNGKSYEGVYIDKNFKEPLSSHHFNNVKEIDIYFKPIVLNSIEDTLDLFSQGDVIEYEYNGFTIFETDDYLIAERQYDELFYVYKIKEDKLYKLVDDKFLLIDGEITSVKELVKEIRTYTFSNFADYYISIPNRVFVHDNAIAILNDNFMPSYFIHRKTELTLTDVNEFISNHEFVDKPTNNEINSIIYTGYKFVERSKILNDLELTIIYDFKIETGTISDLINKKLIDHFTINDKSLIVTIDDVEYYINELIVYDNDKGPHFYIYGYQNELLTKEELIDLINEDDYAFRKTVVTLDKTHVITKSNLKKLDTIKFDNDIVLTSIANNYIDYNDFKDIVLASDYLYHENFKYNILDNTFESYDFKGYIKDGKLYYESYEYKTVFNIDAIKAYEDGNYESRHLIRIVDIYEFIKLLNNNTPTNNYGNRFQLGDYKIYLYSNEFDLNGYNVRLHNYYDKFKYNYEDLEYSNLDIVVNDTTKEEIIIEYSYSYKIDTLVNYLFEPKYIYTIKETIELNNGYKYILETNEVKPLEEVIKKYNSGNNYSLVSYEHVINVDLTNQVIYLYQYGNLSIYDVINDNYYVKVDNKYYESDDINYYIRSISIILKGNYDYIRYDVNYKGYRINDLIISALDGNILHFHYTEEPFDTIDLEKIEVSPLEMVRVDYYTYEIIVTIDEFINNLRIIYIDNSYRRFARGYYTLELINEFTIKITDHKTNLSKEFTLEGIIIIDYDRLPIIKYYFNNRVIDFDYLNEIDELTYVTRDLYKAVSYDYFGYTIETLEDLKSLNITSDVIELHANYEMVNFNDFKKQFFSNSDVLKLDYLRYNIKTDEFIVHDNHLFGYISDDIVKVQLNSEYLEFNINFLNYIDISNNDFNNLKHLINILEIFTMDFNHNNNNEYYNDKYRINVYEKNIIEVSYINEYGYRDYFIVYADAEEFTLKEFKTDYRYQLNFQSDVEVKDLLFGFVYKYDKRNSIYLDVENYEFESYHLINDGVINTEEEFVLPDEYNPNNLVEYTLTDVYIKFLENNILDEFLTLIMKTL